VEEEEEEDEDEDEGVRSSGRKWEVVWGPAVQQHHGARRHLQWHKLIVVPRRVRPLKSDGAATGLHHHALVHAPDVRLGLGPQAGAYTRPLFDST
jgi:hypothetical protein